MACAAVAVAASPVRVPALAGAQAGSGPAATSSPARVVILPFTNTSGRPDDAWIGQGIAETVLADLQRGGALSIVGMDRVEQEVARRGTEPGGEGDADTLDVARALGATLVLTGSYQRLDEEVRVTAQVVSVATGRVTRAVKLDGRVDDLFALQDRIVAELGADLRGPPPAARAAPRPRPQEAARDGAPGRAAAAPVPRQPGRRGGPPEAPGVVDGALRLEGPGAAGAAVSAGALAGRPMVTVRRAAQAPSLDGRLDDRIWQDATQITDFVQRQPVEGAPATEATEVYIAYDSQRLYFGIYAHYSDVGLIRANRADRDQIDNDDVVSVWFDPFLDQQRAYIFTVNGYGVQADSLMSGTGGGNSGGRGGRGGRGGGRGGRGGFPGGNDTGDSSWDALFDSAGQLVEDGWTAEMSIPFKSLRYPSRRANELHRWGFQIQRTIESKNEQVVWAPESRNVLGRLRQMGLLEGMSDLSTSRNLEFLPTVSAFQVDNLDAATGASATDNVAEGGLNVKYGVTSNLTFDFTYNPDFSQIESDQPQIEVNQRFPLFYSELRPFFLEGQEIFDVGGPATFLHTRTIIDPQFGAKLTGKVGNTTVGILVANDEAPGKVDDRTDPAYGQSAQAVVGRVRYDLYSQSHIGLIVTDREFLDASSRLGGIDGRFALGQNNRFEFQTMFTDHVDTAGLERRGSLYNVGFRKQGRNLRYQIESYGIDPGFADELGFVQRTDTRQTTGEVEYRWWPEAAVISWGPRLSYTRNYDYAGVLQDEQVQFRLNGQFSRNITINGNFNRSMERFGGTDFWKTNFSLFGQVASSRRFSIGGGFQPGDQISYDFANPELSFLGRGITYRVFMNLRPISRLQSQVNVNGSSLTDPRTDRQIFDVKIVRAQTTYQFTPRFLLRNILEYNTLAKTFAGNLLLTYRVNAGTVFYLGYDDHYQQGDHIDPLLFPYERWQRTNRAIFTKLQYLFRY